jgi:plasmid stability protein
MAKTVQVRDLDDETYQALSRRAAEVGASVPEFLRREIERIARRPSVTEWLARTQRRSGVPRGSDVIEGLDELRGEWPSRARR